MRSAQIDWGNVWIPAPLPADRSNKSIAEWWRREIIELSKDIQEGARVAIGGGDESPFSVVAYHNDDAFGISSPLIKELSEALESFQGISGTIHPAHRPGLRAQLDDLIAYLQGVRSSIEKDEDAPARIITAEEA